MSNTPCDHAIARGTPRTLDGALAHSPPLAVQVAHTQTETNGMPRGPGMAWPEEADWPPQGTHHFRRAESRKNHPDPHPGRDHGLFTADVTYTHILLRPCAECRDPDPLGLMGALAADGFRRHGELPELAPPDPALALIAAMRPAEVVKQTENQPADTSGLHCPKCGHDSMPAKGPFCRRCGTRKVPAGEDV